DLTVVAGDARAACGRGLDVEGQLPGGDRGVAHGCLCLSVERGVGIGPISSVLPGEGLQPPGYGDHDDIGYEQQSGAELEGHLVVQDVLPPASHDELRDVDDRSEEHTSELQSRFDLVC